MKAQRVRTEEELQTKFSCVANGRDVHGPSPSQMWILLNGASRDAACVVRSVSSRHCTPRFALVGHVPIHGPVTRKMALMPMRVPFWCRKNRSEIAAGVMQRPALPPSPMTMRHPNACAYDCELATPMPPAMAMSCAIRRTGRRPMRWLSGIQNSGAKAYMTDWAVPIHVASDAGTPNSAAIVKAPGA